MFFKYQKGKPGIFRTIKQLLTPPEFTDEEKNRIAQTLHFISLSFLVICILIAVIGLASGWMNTFRIVLAGAVLVTLIMGVSHLGFVRLASVLLLTATLAIASIHIYLGHGIHDIGIVVYPIFIILASLLLTKRFFYIFSFLPLISLGLILILRQKNRVPEIVGRLIISEYVILGLILFVAAVIVRMLINTIQQHLKVARENEAKYRNIFHNIQDIYFEITPDGLLTECSPELERVSGLKREELLNRSILNYYRDPGEHDRFVSRIKVNSRLSDYELELKFPDGRAFHISINASLIRDGQGNPMKIVGSLRDITEKKILQEHLIQAQRLDSIGNLAGGIAHDFNNLLTVINGHSEMALMKMQKQNYQIRGDIKSILNAGKKAEDLIKQLLAFGRKQFASPSVINLNRLIRNLKTIFRRLIDEDIAIKLDLHDPQPNILADPGQVEQVIINLLTNARDAINQKARRAADKQIIIRTSAYILDTEFTRKHDHGSPGPYIRLSVADNGIGMDEKVKNRIFEPFYSTKETGSGLGLSTVYGITKQNNAFILVDSQPGTGTTVDIYWPATARAARGEKKNHKKTDFSGDEHILLVEDDSTVRSFTREILGKNGYPVTEAQDGEQALQILNQRDIRIDLLVSDLKMPRVDGIELAGRALKIFPTLKVLFVSGYIDEPVSFTGIKKEDLHLLQKPFSIEELLMTVRQILDQG